jgi:hypothetical protein
MEEKAKYPGIVYIKKDRSPRSLWAFVDFCIHMHKSRLTGSFGKFAGYIFAVNCKNIRFWGKAPQTPRRYEKSVPRGKNLTKDFFYGKVIMSLHCAVLEPAPVTGNFRSRCKDHVTIQPPAGTASNRMFAIGAMKGVLSLNEPIERARGSSPSFGKALELENMKSSEIALRLNSYKIINKEVLNG